ncbi:MAG: hypothetical protein ACD_38C00167G0003 [uncultured bacterium]|uniref:Uncharacterized protein n=1 Tax=Candidatus Daviesbacteria bacterium GW2011_GWC2_40_12 TaxID=1618431 RepID=A0A0G0QNB8_9BACT|nr:MAG: hypothetical protein ACD_38C00167G0003 [uncultured bacterium]KKQ84507.1 MAG: hypothetical protein UT04_C0015G0015 [Candidatus Daviesbacteria bacterium GW2011_GWF2_38_7]KKR16150.1 MAG: hypothetical protein UT45_C0008G0025 [Candidatus Daviesbacteria bacterium GW2011_GWA2_39_33]KKR41929.1 MAG: hypothetical protein UT77_C0005G0044 [Candidatus Daviesbacteria bacterium GW2011_GWC2_40_12]OGE21777.1 MAG: hypothetical protein A2778_04895 [Candidatus Daviesbacteria bacterium RIFCSPHIGHO2_01_FULL_
MADVVREKEYIPQSSSSDSGGPLGLLIGVIIVVVLIILFFNYLLPVLQKSSAPQINVPGQIDVNVNK